MRVCFKHKPTDSWLCINVAGHELSWSPTATQQTKLFTIEVDEQEMESKGAEMERTIIASTIATLRQLYPEALSEINTQDIDLIRIL